MADNLNAESSTLVSNTPFTLVYDAFLDKITDDMYLELTKEDTYALLEPLLQAAIPYFEFPRVNLTNIDVENKLFIENLTNEEINILATYMVVEWVGQQLASIENTRMKYSGSDFKFTSQANHIQKLTALKKEYRQEGFHLQRLYKRRKVDSNGKVISTLGDIMKG